MFSEYREFVIGWREEVRSKGRFIIDPPITNSRQFSGVENRVSTLN
jgi:hypothetical protein